MENHHAGETFMLAPLLFSLAAPQFFHSRIATVCNPDALCKNTGAFDSSTVPDLSCVFIPKRNREYRETISIKLQLIVCTLLFIENTAAAKN